MAIFKDNLSNHFSYLCQMTRYMILFFVFYVQFAPAQQQIAYDSLSGRDTLHAIYLQEAIVTAQESRTRASSSILSRAAIEHIQPFSLSDIMQLLPGNLTPKVSLHTPQYFRIRSSYTEDYSNTLGTGIWIDGARTANNANLQLGIIPGENAEYGFRGIDTRTIPLTNIESVEVIRGIPSARYGDITTGAVLIHSRAAREPLTFNVKCTPLIKAVQASRGWNTGNNGILNLFAGFTQTYADPRTHERLFRKTEIQAAWSGKFRNMTLNTRLSGSLSLDSDEPDNDRSNGEYTKAKHKVLSANIYGSWQANLCALTSLDYRVTASYAHQDDAQRRKHTKMESIGTNRIIPGEDTAFFIPPNYHSLARIEGIPITVSAALTANLLRQGLRWRSFTTVGAEWNTEENQGEGRMNDPYFPSSLWTRPRSYRDIPSLHIGALFAEENITLAGNAGTLSAEIGLRIARGVAGNMRFSPTAEPRINLRYSPVPAFTLKAGWGRLRKMPSLAYLFPAPIYADHISYRYNDPTTGHRLAVTNTDVIRQANGSISLPRNDKMEIGFTTGITGLKFEITAFSEQLHGGFSLENSLRPSVARIYQNDHLPGSFPVYTKDGVSINGNLLPYTSDTTFLIYNRTANTLSQNKKGVEYIITTKRWNAIYSTLVIDGAWLRTKEQTGGFSCKYNNSEIGGKSYPYAAIFENAHIRIYERLNTNFRLVTYLPFIRFISSITFQSVWIDRTQTRYESQYGNQVYMKNQEGDIINGNIYTNTEYNKYMNPLYYMDSQGNILRFTPEMASNKQYASLVNSESPNTYLMDSFRPYFLINLRITKEIGKHTRLTFYANNIAAMNPSRYTASTASYTTLNPTPFYGAELQLQF